MGYVKVSETTLRNAKFLLHNLLNDDYIIEAYDENRQLLAAFRQVEEDMFEKTVVEPFFTAPENTLKKKLG